MKKQATLLTKTSDLVIGFLGWLLFLNLYFLALLEGAYSVVSKLDGSLLLFGLPTLVVPFVLFSMQRTRIGSGVVAAILVNAGVWIVFALQNAGFSSASTFAITIQAALLPFPLGILLFMA